MNDRTDVQEDRGGLLADHHVGSARITHELCERAVGDRVQAAATPADERVQAVLSVLSSGTPCAQEASRRGVAEADVEHWRQLFIDSGRRGLLVSGRLKPQPSATSLGVQNAALKSALRKKLAELRYCRRAAQELLGPFFRVEEIRRESEITISRFCILIGVSRRTYFRRLVLLRSARTTGGRHDSTSIMSTCAQLVEEYLEKHPNYGYRRIHELMIADGHMVSASTVLRAIRVSQQREGGESQADEDLTQHNFMYCTCHLCKVGQVDGRRPCAADSGAVGLLGLMAIVAAAFDDARVGAVPACGVQLPHRGDVPRE